MECCGWLDEHRVHLRALCEEAARLTAENGRLIEQIQRTHRTARTTYEQIERMRVATAGTAWAARDDDRPARSAQPASAPGPAVAPDPLPAILDAAGLGPDDMGALADVLIEAHRAAEAGHDEEVRAATTDLLRVIGRHLAVKLGPKAGGVTLN